MEALSPLFSFFQANGGILIPAAGVFARLSALAFLLPGLGENGISMRIRLVAVLAISLIIIPALLEGRAPTPFTLSGLFVLVLVESILGLWLGLSLRMFVFTLQILGNIMSQALSISQVLGEGMATEPNTTISTLMMLSGTALLVTLDLHIDAVGLFYKSYEIYPLGGRLNLDALTYWLTHRSMDAFAYGFTLALPFVILNFIYNLILGFLNRAMPQLMVSFVGMPAITGAGILLLSISAGSILIAWSSAYYQVFDTLETLRP